MSYSTLILSLLFLVLSSIPPSFCVYDDGCFRDQAPCNQGGMFPHAKDKAECQAQLVALEVFCGLYCPFNCSHKCRQCYKFMIYGTHVCCPDGYCIPHGMRCNEGEAIVCCNDADIPVKCSSTGKLCCNIQGTNCSDSDACCDGLNCATNMTSGNNVCMSCYPSGEHCLITHNKECCNPAYHCVNEVCQYCALTGENCTSPRCCYKDDKCIAGKCCKNTTNEECIVCASYLESCRDNRSDFEIPCCHGMRCAPNGYCYCRTRNSSCTSNESCCVNYYCDTKNNTCQYI